MDIVDERWIRIPDSNYEASDCGRIRNASTLLILKPATSRGYQRVRLGLGNLRSVHRLVYEAFVGPIVGDMQINHIDGNKANNAVSNLECVTGLENMRHARRTGLFDSWNFGAKLTYEQASQLRDEYAAGTPTRELAKRFGIHTRTVLKVVSGERYAAMV